MATVATNPRIVKRMDELIHEGSSLWQNFDKDKSIIADPVRFTRWTTSCLNLLDKLSVSTNRFASEFEVWAKRGNGHEVNIGAALGVLMAANDEYQQGLAIEYHLSVSSAVFESLLDQAEYLFGKGYLRASVVLAGAALEEALKTRARAVPLELSGKETLEPLVNKLKYKDVAVINEFEAKHLLAIGTMRNDAAHGGEFKYTKEQVEGSLSTIRHTLENILGQRG
jgi:hypothetical protein